MIYKKHTYFLSIILLFIVTSSWGQLVHEGSPFSWSNENNILATTNIITYPEPLLNHVLAEDELNAANKNEALRFAIPLLLSNPVNLETNTGTWRTLPNGDRIWTVVITVPNALGLGVNFGDYYLPKDAKLFLYNQDHTHLFGAYTHHDNTPSNQLVTLPIRGDTLVIEYFEPFEKIGDGRLAIDRINYQYRPIEAVQTSTCSENARCSEMNINNQLNATVKIITDNGTKLGTGVLINDADNNDIPYLLTSSNINFGNPSTWCFLFNDYTISCDNRNKSEDYLITIGADIVDTSEETKTMLLQLKENPTSDWNIFFSGWNRDVSILESAYSLHYSEGGTCQISYSSQDSEIIPSELFLKNTLWDNGFISTGAIGAPLFDEEGLLIGIFTQGNISCENNAEQVNSLDYFVLFSTLWEEYKTFLDPLDSDPVSYAGKVPPVVIENDDMEFQSSFQVFPIPASERINLHSNDLKDTISSIDLINSQGQLIKTFSASGDHTQALSLSGVIPGWYVIVIHSKEGMERMPILIE